MSRVRSSSQEFSRESSRRLLLPLLSFLRTHGQSPEFSAVVLARLEAADITTTFCHGQKLLNVFALAELPHRQSLLVTSREENLCPPTHLALLLVLLRVHRLYSLAKPRVLSGIYLRLFV